MGTVGSETVDFCEVEKRVSWFDLRKVASSQSDEPTR